MHRHTFEGSMFYDMADVDTGTEVAYFNVCVPGLCNRKYRLNSMTAMDCLAVHLLCNVAANHNMSGARTRMFVGWSTHKFQESVHRSDRGAGGSGGRTAVYLLCCDDAVNTKLCKSRRGQFVGDVTLTTLSKIYHTTMRWCGVPTSSSRLLAVEIEKIQGLPAKVKDQWQAIMTSTDGKAHVCNDVAAKQKLY